MKRIELYIALAMLLMAIACKPDKQGEATADTARNDVETRSDKLVNKVFDTPDVEMRWQVSTAWKRLALLPPCGPISCVAACTMSLKNRDLRSFTTNAPWSTR